MNRTTIPQEAPIDRAPSRPIESRLSIIGALTSFGAVLAAASCCVLPLFLTMLGASAGLSSTLAALLPLRWPLTALSIVGLTAGWWVYARRRGACSMDGSCSLPPSTRATWFALAFGTALTLIALCWDRLESPLMKALS